MTGPVPNNQDEPLDPETCRHHLQLLKSAHCARPVLYQGRSQFIKALSINDSGGQIAMTVWLTGIRDGIDSADIEIKQVIANGGSTEKGSK